MTVIYWLAAAFTFAALVCMRSRAAMPGMVFTALALIFAMLTPFGQDVLGWMIHTGPKVAGGAK